MCLSLACHQGGTVGGRDPVTLQLQHAGSTQAIRLPTDKLEQNKKYYVRWTIHHPQWHLHLHLHLHLLSATDQNVLSLSFHIYDISDLQSFV